MTSNLAVGSTFILGVLHALQPGHTNSFLAAYTVGQKFQLKQILGLGASLLISHFLMLTVLAILLNFFMGGVVNEELFHTLEWIAPTLVIGFGLFLLIRYFRQRKLGIECDCGQHHEANHPHFQPDSQRLVITESKIKTLTFSPAPVQQDLHPVAPIRMAATTQKNQNPILAGIVSGLLPCPAVIAPLMLAGVSGSFGNMLLYLLIYVIGMGLVLTTLVAGLYFTKDFIVKRMGDFKDKFDTRWVAAALVILVGVVYLGVNLMGYGAHVH